MTHFELTFLIDIDVGLHVPDDLMTEKLGRLSGPDQVVSDVAHCVIPRTIQVTIDVVCLVATNLTAWTS